MTKRQKELLDILDKIGEVQTKRRKDRHKEDSLLSGVEDMENLLAQCGLVEKKPEESEQKKLTKSEMKMLIEGCRLMQNGAVETASICTALGALVISVMSVIVATEAMVVSAANPNTLFILVPVVCVATVINALAVIMFVKAVIRVSRNAKKADRYRNVCLALLALSEEETERENEP